LLGGETHNYLGRLNADGTVDSAFNAGADGYVYSLAVQTDGKIVVGGAFKTLNGQTRTNLGRLSGDGTLDTGFNPAPNSGVESLVVQADGKILVGGFFNILCGQTRNRLGRLNDNGTLDTGFTNPVANSTVKSLVVQADGKIVVGGWFNTLGWQTRNCIGRVNADGTLDIGFNPDARRDSDAVVLSLALQTDGMILVGGQFATLNGQTRTNLGRLNVDGTLDNTFDPEADLFVTSLAVQADGKVLVGGAFRNLGGQTRKYIARLNADGSLDTGFNPGSGGAVSALAVQADGKIVVGGFFTTLHGQMRTNIGRLHGAAAYCLGERIPLPPTAPGTNNLSGPISMSGTGSACWNQGESVLYASSPGAVNITWRGYDNQPFAVPILISEVPMANYVMGREIPPPPVSTSRMCLPSALRHNPPIGYSGTSGAESFTRPLQERAPFFGDQAARASQYAFRSRFRWTFRNWPLSIRFTSLDLRRYP
jgi:uncharacterized delta-60 repeat protein